MRALLKSSNTMFNMTSLWRCYLFSKYFPFKFTFQK
jgi:hypothetical protein